MVTIVAGDGVTLLTDEDKSISGSAAAIGNPGDTLSYGVTRNAAHGSVTGDAATGAFTYTPAADFFGNDSFDVTVIDGHGGSDTLRVEVTVAPVNDAPRPTTTAPLAATGNEEAPITGTVAVTDPENNSPIRYAIGAPAKNGRVNIDQNGNYTYTGNKDFFGEDGFTVLVTDSLGATSAVPVTVTVNNVNDAPHFIVGTAAQVTATKNIAATRSFFAADPDGDALTYHVGSLHPSHGDLGIDPRTGAFTYTPDEDYLGSDQFTLEARDTAGGVATLTVNLSVTPVATFQRQTPDQVVSIGPDGNSALRQQSFIYDNFKVDIYSAISNPSSGTFLLPVTDYVFGVVTGNLPTPDGESTYSESSNGYVGIDFSDQQKVLGMTTLAPGYGAHINATGSAVSNGSASIFNVTDTGSWRVDRYSASPAPPLLPIEAFDQSPFPSVLTGFYPGTTLEEMYAGYVADYPDIFVDQTFTISNAGGATFQAMRGDIFAQSPALQAFLDQFWSSSIDPDAATTQLAANAAPTTTYSYTNSFTADININPRGGPQLAYFAVTDNNLPRLVVTPVGGSFEDRDGDGDFDFHGEVEISFRGSDVVVLRLKDADVQMDLSVLHVTGATVYAAISEDAGLLDPLFKGSFDLDRKSGTVLSFSAEAPPEGDSNPYYAPGGLALTYSSFAFTEQSVVGFAKMAMPVPIFDSMNLDLAQLTGATDNGGFTFAADHYGLAGGSASLGGIEGDFFGLFQIAADDIVLTYDNVTDTFLVDGEITVKSPILDLIPGAKDPELTFTGLKLHDGKFSFDGELAIDELKLPGGFGLSDITLSLTLADDVVTAFSGETHITLGDGRPEPIFGIGFQRPPLSFDKITLGADNLGVPLGDGVFLEKIQGALENLADVPPETAPGVATTFTGTLGFGWGPEIEAFELPEFLGGAEVGGGRIANLEITGTMDFENSFNETITLNYLSDNLIKMTGSATVDLGQNSFSGLLSYDVLDGIATGQMLTVSNGHGIAAHGNQTLNIPSLADWGPLSGLTGLAAEAFLSISTDVPSQSFFAAWTTLNLPVVGALTVGFKIDAGSGFDLLVGGNDIPKTRSFDVDGTEDWLLITASWENETQGHVLTQVRTPDNTFLQEADYAANGITLVPDLTSPFKTAIVIDNPRAGNWDLQVIQPGVGTVQYHGISPNPAEQFAFAPIVSTAGDIEVSLGGLLAGAPAGSTVSFFYDTDGAGFDGSIIGTDTVGADGAVALTWTLAGTPRGDYHIYAVAFDGMNAPTMLYADDIVHVALAPTDVTIGGVAVSEQSTDIDVREDAATGTVVGTLGVIDPDFGTGATFALLNDAGGRFALIGDQIVVTERAFLDADIDPTIDPGEGSPIIPDPPIHTITVRATDADGLSITRGIAINVTDVLGDIDYIMGDESGNSVSPFNPNDTSVLLGRGGDDTLSGGNSEDIAVFSGFRRSYAFTAGEPADTIRDLRPNSPDGTDTAYGVEIYRFADGDFSATELEALPNVTLQVVELDPLAENAAVGTLAAEASIINPTDGEIYTFALADDMGGLFRLAGNQVLLNGALDFETTSFYTLKLQATDTSGFVYEESVFVEVSDADEGTTGPATGTPLIVGTLAEGQILTVDVSSVQDPDGIELIGYQWQRSTDGGLTFTDATAFLGPVPTYRVQAADVGAVLRVTVAVKDLNGDFSGLFSDLTAVVITNNHEPTGVPLIEGSTVAGRTLTADISGVADADGIPAEVSFTWIRVQGGSEQAVGFEETYTLQGDDIGARLKVIASYQDDGGVPESIESALSNPVTQFPDGEVSRFEFATGGGTIQENLFGAAIGTILFDGLDNPSLTYSVFDAASLGLFEMDGNVLKLKDGIGLDFEVGGTARLIAVAVFDGDTPVYANTMTVTVLNQPATLDNAPHDAIPDATVFDDVKGLIGLAGPDGLTPRQWVNERDAAGALSWDIGPIEVEFAASSSAFRDFRSQFARPFDDDERDAALNVFSLVSGYSGVDFVETSFSTQPHIRMAVGALSSGILGQANGVGSEELLVGQVVAHGDPTLLGSDFHNTLMHELGHTLGLDHGHNIDSSNGFGDELPHLPLDHDRSAYSVMTYNNTDGSAQTYMMADIATLQYLYGADFNANSGDTVYSWSETTGETFVNGVSMGATASNTILMTVWDGNGNDTYDASNYDGGVEIDLRPGELSTLSVAQLGKPGALGNVGNAYLYYGNNQSLIEHAIGGDGDDTLTGNTASNRLKGNGGNDTIDGQGGGGEDVAVYDGARTDYSLARLANGDITVTDLRDGSPDGTDTVREVEIFEFDGFRFSAGVLNNPPTGAVVIVGDLLVGETLTLDTSTIADTEAVATPFTVQWARVRAGAAQIVGSGDSYTLTADDVGARIKATVFYQDGEAHDEEISSALSAPAAAFAGQEFPRLEFAQGGGTIRENIYDGRPVSIMLFDGLMNEDLTYTITSDPSGAFELAGVMLRLKLGVGVDFEAAASRPVEITVTDGAGLSYAQTVNVQVLDEAPSLGTTTHAPISDATVAADVAGLLNDGTADGLSQWVNETASDGKQTWESGLLKVLFLDAAFGSASPLFVRDFDAGEKAAARAVFSLISSYAAIELVEGATQSDSHAGLAIGTASIALATPGDGSFISVAAADDAAGLGAGSPFGAALLRQLGHVLGLEKGDNSLPIDVLFGDPLPHLPLDHDRSAYSAMTLNDTDGTPQTFMMADIATLQFLYGADFTTNSGNTVYTWSETTGETFIDGVSTGPSAASHILMTVWDGGGTDTYDASNYDGGAAIDLRPGAFSTLSSAQLGKPTALGNVGNAYLYYGDTRSLIENAIGGAGADTLVGNQGDNRLTGNGGADDIDGGDGTDTAAFSGAHTDYQAELLGNGAIRITDLRAGAPDGVDTVRNVESFAFLDGTFAAATMLNDPPIVSGPVALAPIAEDSGARLITQAQLLANASDSDSLTLTAINLAIGTGLGTLIDNHDGTWSFTSAADDDTAVSFSYSVTDGFNAVATSATLDITPVSDAPPITPGTPGDDSFTAPTGQSQLDAGLGTDTITFDFALIDASFAWSGNTVTVDTATSHTILAGFETFVFSDGTVHNRDGNALVDDLFYYARNHDVWAAHVEADLHYAQQGWQEGRDPSAFFSTQTYLAMNADVKAADINPLVHFDLAGWLEGRIPSFDFDPAKYLAANPDVAAAHVDPLAHFLQSGAEEGRQPFPVTASAPTLGPHGFDAFYYLLQNPDVAAAGVDPFWHFQAVGWKEGRDPNALFDIKGYLAAYDDVRAAGINPLDHYDAAGWLEGRDPSAAFDTSSYLSQNPDVAAAHVNPLIHYLQVGASEGRTAVNDGLFAFAA